MYSSIEEEARKEVIKKCYWPIFNLADIGVPIGIEAPAVTLQYINKFDPDWISSLSKYITEGKIEFIGSGYSQIIGPLVPAKVNEWNQELGIECYQKILGINPKIALVNEMAYSGGIVEHYCNAGYKGLIMEWNNPRTAHPEWKNEWRYFPQQAKGTNDKTIPLIWADSISFQKYQRYAHGEYELDEYVKYLKSHIGDKDSFFPLYSNDVEIFNFRPGRYHTETGIKIQSEWQRIIDLYKYLKQQDWCEFVFPSQVLSGLNDKSGGNELTLESTAQPIPVKKQEKYNINRWALTGRDDLGINSICYKIYKSFAENDNKNPEDWKELCYLWSSDFRTHITDLRWQEFRKRLIKLNNKFFRIDQKKIRENKDSKNNSISTIEDDRSLIVENDEILLVLNKNKGYTIKEFYIKSMSDKSFFGILDHGYYDDISLGADYYSGHAVVDIPGEHKITDLNKSDLIINRMNDSVSIVNSRQNGNYIFKNKIVVSSTTLTIEKTLEIKSDEKSIIRPVTFTFIPEAWDNKSLYIQTHNGGNKIETFYFNGQTIAHGEIYSSLISARHGFGNTEGIFIIGDKNKSLTFECDMIVSALIPSIIYKEMDSTYFFRLQYSAREMDETRKKLLNENIIRCQIKITASKNV